MGFWDVVSDVGDAISDGASAVAGAVEDAAGAVVDGVEDAAGAVAAGAEDVFQAGEGFAADAFNVVSGAAVDVFGAIEEGVEDAAKAVEHGVEDAAKATESFVKKAAKAVAGAVSDAAEGVWNGAVDVAKGVAGGVVDFATGITEGLGGFISNLAQGHVGDAFDSLIRGADKAFLQAPQRVMNGFVDGAQDTLDGVSHLLPDPVGSVARQVIDRGADVFRTVANTSFELVRDGFRLATELPLNFGKDLVKVGDDLIHGNFKEAAKDFGGAFVHAGGRLVGTAVDMIGRSVQGAASIVEVSTGLQPPSRKLTEQEKDILRKVYGDSVDLDAVRIVEGGPLNADINGRARTIGNTIYMPSGYGAKDLVDSKGNLTETGKLLCHETGHVWQSENGGGDYISKALYGQLFGDGYDYQKAIDDGKSFDELNPEQQAEYIEQELAPVLAGPGGGSAEDKLRAKYGSDPAKLEYALNALRDIRSGVGAP